MLPTRTSGLFLCGIGAGMIVAAAHALLIHEPPRPMTDKENQ